MSPEEQNPKQAEIKPKFPNNVYEFHDSTGGAPTPAERAVLDQKKAEVRDSYLPIDKTASLSVNFLTLPVEATISTENSDDLFTDEELLEQEQQKLENEEMGNNVSHSERSHGFIDFIKSRNGKIVLGTAALVATFGAIFGTTLANSAQQTVKAPAATALPQPASSAPVVPSATSSPEITPAPNTEIIPDGLKAIQAETADQFASEPEHTSLEYMSWLERGDVKPFADEYAAVSKNPIDVYPDRVSIDNTPQEIILIAGTNLRIAYTQENAQESLKTVMASLKHGKASEAYPYFSEAFQKPPFLQYNAQMLAASGAIVTSQAVGETLPVQINNVGEKYRDIAWTSSGKDYLGNAFNRSGTTRYYYVEYTNYKKEQTSTWLQQ